MNIQEILKENNKRVTTERILIFNFLETKHLFSYNDILNNFKTIWRASVFRTLQLFLELWVIKKVDLWDKVMTYEINNLDHAHEHMKCKKCNSITNFNADDIYKKLFQEAKKIWFEIKSNNIWILWTCKKCL